MSDEALIRVLIWQNGLLRGLLATTTKALSEADNFDTDVSARLAQEVGNVLKAPLPEFVVPKQDDPPNDPNAPPFLRERAMMETIQEEWDQFAATPLPALTEVQRNRTRTIEMRRAFYAGVRAMLKIMDKIDDDVETGEAQLEALSHELNRFHEDMEGGRA